ncbi:MAG: hypothetical protein SGI92_30710 [Bryobacteraceae bacterium]|nr:hypothetical protein [Bryobacteraceae bacterium]
MCSRAGAANQERRYPITGALESLLQRARQRHTLNLVLEYLAVAGGIGAVGLILLLILGRQILDWYWPVLLFAVALVAGLWRARKRVLTEYRIAQVVDERLGLEDRLSTIVDCREGKASPEFLAIVARQAEERIRPEDAPRAMPVSFPKYGYACAGLLFAAGTLVGVRYGVLHTMDLNPPLANITFDPFQPEPKAYASTKKSAIQERWEQQLKELGLTPEDMEVPIENGLKTQEMDLTAVGNDPSAAPPEKQPGVKDIKAPAGEEGENSEGGEKSQGDKSDSASGDTGSDQKGDKGQKKDAPDNAKNSQPGSQDGLMNKMKDALSNLMNKMKNPGQEQQQTAQGNPQDQQGQNAKQQQQQGMQSQGKQQGEGQPSEDQQGDSQNGEKVAGDKSKAGEKSGDKPGDQNSKSGQGSQDGEKAIREAQQLAAMGKLSEILGKRAQQVTGEMSVEVSSGKQQLKTQWSERKALHADTGAETNRNEIPLAYQSYIQRYFEEVRKSPGGGKAKTQPAP